MLLDEPALQTDSLRISNGGAVQFQRIRAVNGTFGRFSTQYAVSKNGKEWEG
jgi:hypothetical protein